MNRALRAYCSTVGVGLALALTACASNQFGSPCPIPDKATDEQKQAALNGCNPGILQETVDFRTRKEVNILFAIDNSTSMSPKQAKLAEQINNFITAIAAFDADLHIGVVTSDIGSYTGEGVPWNTTIQGCGSFKGDDGVLQVKGCGTRMASITPDAQNACVTNCSTQFRNLNSVTMDGKRFLTKVDGKTNVLGDDLTNAFKCMALVGDGGCGIEGQLESVKRALDGHLQENTGFLSNGALLAIIFITDEDDCSVKIDRRNENNPSTRDCSAGDQNASYDCFNYDYRCLARSVQCNEPMNTVGQKTACKERQNNYLESIKKYHDFFISAAGGENKLLISGIWTPNTIDKNDKLFVDYSAGMGAASSNLNRAPGVKAACVDSSNASIFGQAQRRWSEFAASYGTYLDSNNMPQPSVPEFSVCDTGGYTTALDNIKKAIERKLLKFCLPQQPKLLAPGVPNCLVGDVDVQDPNSLPDSLLPICSSTCCNGWATAAQPATTDPTVRSACMAESKDCYCAVKANACNDPGESGWVGGVWRKGGIEPPVGKVISFRCAKGP